MGCECNTAAITIRTATSNVSRNQLRSVCYRNRTCCATLTITAYSNTIVFCNIRTTSVCGACRIRFACGARNIAPRRVVVANLPLIGVRAIATRWIGGECYAAATIGGSATACNATCDQCRSVCYRNRTCCATLTITAYSNTIVFCNIRTTSVCGACRIRFACGARNIAPRRVVVANLPLIGVRAIATRWIGGECYAAATIGGSATAGNATDSQCRSPCYRYNSGCRGLIVTICYNNPIIFSLS